MFNSLEEIKELGINIYSFQEDNIDELTFINIFNGHFDADTNDKYILNYIAIYYLFVIKDNEIAKKYYLKSVEQGHIKAIFNLGKYYADIEKDYDMMEKYHNMAISK